MCKILMNLTNVSSTVILHNDVDHEVLCVTILTGNILSKLFIKLHKHKYAYSDRHRFAHP